MRSSSAFVLASSLLGCGAVVDDGSARDAGADADSAVDLGAPPTVTHVACGSGETHEFQLTVQDLEWRSALPSPVSTQFDCGGATATIDASVRGPVALALPVGQPISWRTFGDDYLPVRGPIFMIERSPGAAAAIAVVALPRARWAPRLDLRDDAPTVVVVVVSSILPGEGTTPPPCSVADRPIAVVGHPEATVTYLGDDYAKWGAAKTTSSGVAVIHGLGAGDVPVVTADTPGCPVRVSTSAPLENGVVTLIQANVALR